MADENEAGEGNGPDDQRGADQGNGPDDENGPDETDLPTVGSGRVDTLFDELEEAIESLDGFADELDNLRNRIEADEGETSGHVRNRITQDAGQLEEELDENADRLREELLALERAV